MAMVLTLFGAVTLFMSSAVIFDLFGVREKEGNYVLFVVAANFVCSLLYLPAAYGLYKRKPWAVTLLVISLVILILTFAGLLLHIQSGGLFEKKTVGALLFRMVLTGLLAFFSYRALPQMIRKGGLL
jgi:hypothetical protein